jgi:regulator of PEP synthase PpsR (kinase-PPPase family)
MYAQQIFNEQPNWAVVDVTNKPIEEIAFEIVSIMRE